MSGSSTASHETPRQYAASFAACLIVLILVLSVISSAVRRVTYTPNASIGRPATPQLAAGEAVTAPSTAGAVTLAE